MQGDHRLALVADVLEDVIWVTTRDFAQTLYVNPAYERIWGRTITSLYADGLSFTESIHPDDRDRVSSELRAVGDAPFALEYRIVRDDGSIRWISDLGYPVLDGGEVRYYAGIAKDVTEARRVEAEHAQFVERLRLISAATSDGIWDWNVVTGEAWWSEAHLSLVGLGPRTPASYEAWVATIHPDDRRSVLARFDAAVESGTSWFDEYRIMRPDGTVLEVQDRARVIRDAAGKPLRVVGALIDVTERRQLERQVRHAQKMEALGHLAGGVAHDFNNILQAALLELALLRTTPDLPLIACARVAELRGIIERAATLTRQLLVFSRREAMRLQRIDINSRVAEVAGMLRRVIGERIALHLDVGPGALVANADPSMIDQVVLNLAVNARDAMPAGGALTIQTSTRTRSDRPFVCITVTDTGAGITAEDLPRIFEPFFTTKEVGRGTGLGLATVHGIVEQHGGAVEVASAPGLGSTFDIYLPLADSDADRPAPRLAPAGESGHETILLVEDDTPVRTAMRSLLEAAGYQVIEAERAASALASWDARGGQIDLVLTDLVMPGMNGTELADALVARRSDVRIIFVTGYSAHSERCNPKYALLHKPIDPDQLLRHVRSSLDAGADAAVR